MFMPRGSSGAGFFQNGKSEVRQVPASGLVVYGNGLVFGGKVYPVLVDGVPMSLPAAAQEAAAMQRLRMQLHGQQSPKSFVQKLGVQQQHRGYQQPTESSYRHSQQNFSSQLHFQQQQQRQQLRQQQRQQQPQHQQQWMSNYNNMRSMQNASGSDVDMIQSPQMFNYNYDYGYVPTRAESSGWNGYASCQPMDASKPFAFGWSPTD